MPRISIHLPALLADSLGERELHVDALTLDAALLAFRTAHPRAATHVFDDAGKQRRHVLLFLNDHDTRWIENPRQPLRPGDCLRVVQAISGG
ncbi:MAG TPA: MoaD/ThiS family protein [Tepidisphaeraceae bacterium]|jgi:molybdopterin converting factor small subunit